jgi:hypothetical protein
MPWHSLKQLHLECFSNSLAGVPTHAEHLLAAFPSLCGPTHPKPSQLGWGRVTVEARSSNAALHHSLSWSNCTNTAWRCPVLPKGVLSVASYSQCLVKVYTSLAQFSNFSALKYYLKRDYIRWFSYWLTQPTSTCSKWKKKYRTLYIYIWVIYPTLLSNENYRSN